MTRPGIGVMLPMSDPGGRGTADVAAAARHLEAVGAETVWVGDHLSFHVPVVEAGVALATAAAVTERVQLGFGVLLLALRHPAWTAKLVTSLQAISGDRVVLGIGVGGENPQEWAAAGVPVGERGRRTDVILAALPDLLAGRPARIGAPYDLDVPALAPSGAVPPVWIGGRSDAALHRAARHGQGWLGMWADERRIRGTVERLGELAQELDRPRARTGLLVFTHIGSGPTPRAESAAMIKSQYRLDFDRVERYVLAGSPAEVTERLQLLVDSGVEELMLFPAAVDHRAQYDAIGEVVSEWL